jgi:hypothetical protein
MRKTRGGYVISLATRTRNLRCQRRSLKILPMMCDFIGPVADQFEQ